MIIEWQNDEKPACGTWLETCGTWLDSCGYWVSFCAGWYGAG